MSQRCTATTRRGLPCRAWAVRGSDPPRCVAHGSRTGAATARDRRLDPAADASPERSRPPAMPAKDGDGALLRRRFDAVIEDLQRRHWDLSNYIDDHTDEMRSAQLFTAIRLPGAPRKPYRPPLARPAAPAGRDRT